jgi:hypothetical protein
MPQINALFYWKPLQKAFQLAENVFEQRDQVSRKPMISGAKGTDIRINNRC